MRKCMIVLFVSLLFLPGCVKNEEPSAGPETDSLSAAPETRLTLNPSEKTVPTAPAATGGNRTPTEVLQTINMSNQEKLSFRNQTEPLLPEDMVIGPLGDEYNRSPVLKTVDGFLNSLKKGDLDQGFFMNSSRSYLKGIFEPIIEEKVFPESFRLGRVLDYDPDFASVNVRLFRGICRAAGEITLQKEGDDWRITDIQLDLADLKTDYKKEFEVYEPQTYRWLELY